LYFMTNGKMAENRVDLNGGTICGLELYVCFRPPRG